MIAKREICKHDVVVVQVMCIDEVVLYSKEEQLAIKGDMPVKSGLWRHTDDKNEAARSVELLIKLSNDDSLVMY